MEGGQQGAVRLGLDVGERPAAPGQHHARRELGLLGVHDLAVRQVRALPAPAPGVERFDVVLTGPDGEVSVTVRAGCPRSRTG